MTIQNFYTLPVKTRLSGMVRLLVFFLFCLPEVSKAQFTEKLLIPADFYKAKRTITDSLYVADQNLKKGNAASAERTTTYLLTTFPIIPTVIVREFSTGIESKQTIQGYPAYVFAVRAKARETLGNNKAAETDFTAALGHLNQRYFTYREAHEQVNLWDYYEQRAKLRFNHLRNQKGGCADLNILFKIDSTRAASLGFKGCNVPRLKFVNTAQDYEEARQAASDSLLKAEIALTRNQHVQAIRILNNLIAGRVSNFEKFMVRVEKSDLKVKIPGQLYGMRAQAKQGLKDFKGAKADLDSAIIQLNHRCNTSGDGLWHFRRGLLRMDHLQDREGGCADLAKAYQCDTTITSQTHPKWRDCMLPAYKRVIGGEEYEELLKSVEQTTANTESLIEQGKYDQAIQLSSDLIRRRAGRFEKLFLGRGERELETNARFLRFKALHGQQRYMEALADLDSAIRINKDFRTNGWLYCERAIFKIDVLNDLTGCEDMRRCYFSDAKPKDGNWRKCKIEERTASYKLWSRYWVPVFGDIDDWDLQLGVFNQGKTGFSVGAYNSPGEWLFNWGPSLGLDIMSGHKSALPVLAPKAGFEGNFVFASTRLDLGYYGYKGTHDLRLTPQAGLGFLAIINGLYGYSIPLLSDEHAFLSRHRISLYINFVELTKIGG